MYSLLDYIEGCCGLSAAAFVDGEPRMSEVDKMTDKLSEFSEKSKIKYII